jgi:hypothetical protein
MIVIEEHLKMANYSHFRNEILSKFDSVFLDLIMSTHTSDSCFW